MVICKRSEKGLLWNAFGFLGQGGAGKSSLSFILGRLLVEMDHFIIEAGTSLKILDDNFTLENGLVSSSNWGGDTMGKQQQFIDCLKKVGHSDQEARPLNHSFKIGTFRSWLLLSGEVSQYVIQQTDRDDFIRTLLPLNPCHSPRQDEIDGSPQIREHIRGSFDPSWNYAIVTRRNTRSREDEPLLEKLAREAYDVWRASGAM
jgi:hypothetical protein